MATHSHPDLFTSVAATPLTRRTGIETELHLDIRRRCIGISVSIIALVSVLMLLWLV
ncbi:hypothetical protein [Williamsia sp. CHRR-6]|uniref:hypothetical protein n=1 Tax=Williamsia sp. CHRR-6 TaxID=2835871 RepID=UPI001BDA5A5A|nr:hypothetical protein [Williamsia sp. CHRR-6]MBT0567641.1 hypothetical protein [Williamsia sp. CHRR-6]